MNRAPYKKYTVRKYTKDPSDAWCFTVTKNADIAYERMKKLANHPFIKEIYYQKEYYAKGDKHIQGYVLFKKIVDYLWMLKFVEQFEKQTNFANRIGTHEQARDYATKQKSRVAGTTVQLIFRE